MKTDIPDTLQAALDGYLRFFDMTSALGGLLFGASVFLLTRAVGLVRDDGFADVTHLGLVLISGLCALAMIVFGFFAQNVTLSFNVELLRSEPYGGCEFPQDLEPATFFMDCHRKWLRFFVWIDMVASLVGIVCIGIWFVLRSRDLKHRSLSNEKT